MILSQWRSTISGPSRPTRIYSATTASMGASPARSQSKAMPSRSARQGRSYGPIRVSAEKDPTKVPFHGVDVAMECTGHFAKKESASQLLTAGARKVLVSAPAAGADATIVYGVNEKIDYSRHDGGLQCFVHDKLPWDRW